MGFWQNRWQSQQIGWHRAEYNDLMVKHWPSLEVPDGSEVLVPCVVNLLTCFGWQNKVIQS